MALLLIWLLVNLVGPWFARDLDRIHGLGFPFGFWIAAKGVLLLYLFIIVVYVHVMDRLERRYHEDATEADGGPEAGAK